jgi:hypothetical protein
MEGRWRHMGSRRRNICRGPRIEAAMVAFISLQPVVAFSITIIMVLAPLLLLPLMLAMSSTTENSKTQPERRCRLVVLGRITVGRIAWGIPIVFAGWHIPRGIPVELIRLRIPTAAVISTACTQACQGHYQM